MYFANKKKLLKAGASFFLSAVICFQPSFAEAASITLIAPSAVLLDGRTEKVLYAKAPHVKRAPASTTKLLTAMVALDHLPMDKIVRIPAGLEHIQPTKIGLRGGERFYVRDLVRATLIKSANDAAEALAILTAGSRPAFAKLMNQKAKRLGARNSHFVNPNGLPNEAQYSTAYDLARIMMGASRYPFIVGALKTRSMIITSQDGRQIALSNCNKMLWRTGGVIGKTGWTRKARHCFAGRVISGDQTIFVGLMGTQSRQYLWSDLRRIAAIPSGKMPKPIASAPKMPTRQETIKIQKALGKAGYFKGKPTGFFGKRTKASVLSFQKAKGLKADGIVGPVTWKKLKEYL